MFVINSKKKNCERHNLHSQVAAVRIDPCSTVANALGIPSEEYVRKNETQRN